MSKFITEDDAAVGYSSEQDDFDSEMMVKDIVISSEPNEIYVGNTGQVDASQFHSEFRFYGAIMDMHIWRTHNHLYHARIVYQNAIAAERAITQRNGTFYNGRRLRVSLVKDRIWLEYAASLRIDDICAECSEEDIYDHFVVCGDIRFVIKTGYAAYVQFSSPLVAAKALDLEMILNGDPYTLSRIFSDDRKDHVQIIESMKEIKYRKPFVMVENFPRLDKKIRLGHYKTNFQAIGPVRHFKIAPTGNDTVTLALCIDKLEDREAVIARFNETILDNKQLKLFTSPAKARMTINHATVFASCKSTIVVHGIPPYYKDYDVCKMFRRCGEINLVERFINKWMVCFDDHSAVSLAQFYHFIIAKKRLGVELWSPETLPIKIDAELLHYEPPKPKGPRKFKYDLKKDVDSSKALQAAAESVKVELAATSAAKMAEAAASGAMEEHSESLDPDEKAYERGPRNAVRISNLPKGIIERDMHELFQDKPIHSMIIQCALDSYHPSAEALISFTQKNHAKEVLTYHQQRYRGNRVIITRYATGFFMSETGVICKNLGSSVSAEQLLDEVEKVLGKDSVEDVLKPAHHYAYVDFKGDLTAKNAINRLRDAFTKHGIDVYPLYLAVPKWSTPSRPHKGIRLLSEARKTWGLKQANQIDNTDRHFGVNNAHKLFVGNIPRDTAAEDIIDYFNNFGDVIDYKPIEKKSCYLRKSIILSFVNSKHAENAYLRRRHYFEGSVLDVHLMDCPPYHFASEAYILTIKFHSPFLTIDEIRYELRRLIDFSYALKFDAYNDRANYIVKYRLKSKSKDDVLTELANIEYINDEAVVFVDGLDLTPPDQNEAREKKEIILSQHRKHKESYLSFVVYKENLKEDMEIRTKATTEENVPLKMFFNDNSIQINNVSVSTKLEEIRDLFRKCGNITDYRALILDEDQTKICFVKFENDLAADLACTFNQRMLNGKRLLIHLVKEAIHIERGRSVFVERLNPRISTEDIYDAFSSAGVIKYVQKQSPFTAIICFKGKESCKEAMSISHGQTLKGAMVDVCEDDYDNRFYNNFSVKEEHISFEQIRTVLKPGLRPEFHQSEIDGLSLETLPGEIKSSLISEVFKMRATIRDFNRLNKTEQVSAIKGYANKSFTQKEFFLKLSYQEQEKLLDITAPLERGNVASASDPSPAKRVRQEETVTTFAANWYSEPTSQQNAQHIAQTLPGSGLLLGSSIPSLTGGPSLVVPPPPRAPGSDDQSWPNPYAQAAGTSGTYGSGLRMPSSTVDRRLPPMSSSSPGQVPMRFSNNPVRPPPRPAGYMAGPRGGPRAPGRFSNPWADRSNNPGSSSGARNYNQSHYFK